MALGRLKDGELREKVGTPQSSFEVVSIKQGSMRKFKYKQTDNAVD